MRLFYLENEQSTRVPLNAENGILLKHPAGLGIDMDLASSFISDQFQALTRKRGAIGKVTCDLVFLQNAYASYSQLATWCATADRLFIVYRPFGSVEYYTEVSLEFIHKTELDRAGVLVCPAAFLCLTPWYRRSKLNIRLDRAPTEATRFGAAVFGSGLFTPAYDSGFTAEIPTDGQLPAVLELNFTGVVTNPRIELRGIRTGQLYCRAEVSTAITAGDRLEYSANPADTYIRKVSQSGIITDLMDSVDPFADPFGLMPNTEPVRLTFSGDEEPDGTAEAAVRYYFRSV